MSLRDGPPRLIWAAERSAALGPEPGCPEHFLEDVTEGLSATDLKKIHLPSNLILPAPSLSPEIGKKAAQP